METSKRQNVETSKRDRQDVDDWDRFWDTGPEFEEVRVHIEPPETPLALLKQLGPSPFEPGGFPLIGFLATTYDKVSRYALERRSAHSS